MEEVFWEESDCHVSEFIQEFEDNSPAINIIGADRRFRPIDEEMKEEEFSHEQLLTERKTRNKRDSHIEEI